MTVLAELGDLTRFDSPRELMSFLGLVPSERSSGGRRRGGKITKTGNGHARRVPVEAAWSYRFPARKTAHLRRKAERGTAYCPSHCLGGRRSACVGATGICITRARRNVRSPLRWPASW